MKYGYIKVCAATPELRVADVGFNAEKIIEAIKESSSHGSQLTVFPELSLCGYTCGDLFNQTALISACDKYLIDICKATVGIKTLVFVGAPVIVNNKLYNCAVAISNGTVLGVIPKTYLPNYGEFYERRYFSPYSESCKINIAGQKDIYFGTKVIFAAENCTDFAVSAEICEDLWAPASPSITHSQAGANIIVNLSCSDEIVGKAEYRRELVKVQSAKLVCGYVYCDAGEGESSTDMTFAGHNIISENGKIISESNLFDNGLLYGEIDIEMLANVRCKTASSYYDNSKNSDYTCINFETDNAETELIRTISKTPFIPSERVNERGELILTIQQKGLEKRLRHTNAKTAVIG
ncbi:MAG: NAD(+) synthase, partial [Clostridia bacterium]|nr:NAD(+) synthase [Clostridia bacterium]